MRQGAGDGVRRKVNPIVPKLEQKKNLKKSLKNHPRTQEVIKQNNKVF